MVQYIGFSRKIAGIKPNKIPSLWKGYASMDGNFMVPATFFYTCILFSAIMCVNFCDNNYPFLMYTVLKTRVIKYRIQNPESIL